ncbi:TonB-dependent receptor [Caenibius sp. WL]|uniref:TonB-dependent receptor n=1 Tax=Caenibius sp. WL TaxID=2872646 RepID=UPI001C9A0A39|nr:TonB-dependent receptor [Caenibius sp. WL]QZP09203.1 TonB-dependent receptor [Caenibius sp. WL]
MAATVGLMVGAAPAFAQDAEPQPTGQSASSGLADIVVTARRKEESLQSVPISVQAFSGDMLSERNVQDATDLQRIVPALTTYQQARDEVTMSIRGQSSSGASAQGQNPRVTAYFAQVPLQTGDTGPGKFFDLQNVQVLKGPQGTLFGRNSTGGAVLYEPARPTHNTGGYVNLQYGRFNDRQIEGAINLPAGDTLAFRFAGKLAKRDGFTKNIVTGQELDDRNYFGLRGSMLWTPSDRFENFLMFDYMHSNTNGSSQQIAGIDTNKVLAPNVNTSGSGPAIPLTLGGNGPTITQLITNPATYFPLAVAAGRVSMFPNPALPNQVANQIKYGPRISQSIVDGLSKSRGWGITNISTFEISDNLTLKNIFGYRRYKQLSRYDMDGTAYPLLDQVTPDGDWSVNLRQISNETQLQGKAFDGALDFTIGAFVLWSKSPSPQRTVQVSVGTPSLSVSSPVERSQALFGQFTYDFSNMGVEGLSFTAGYRYTHDFRSVSAQNYRDASATAANGWKFSFASNTCSLVNGCPTFTKASFNASSYNIGLDYQVNPTTLVYFTHRRGYRAGGLNPQALDFGVAYGPEKVTDFELGLKTDFSLGGMEGRLNLAGFISQLKDAQVSQAFSTQNPVTGQLALINLIVNAAKAKIKGLEADLTLKPFEHLTLGASYSLTDAKYSSFLDVQTGKEITNRPFPFLAKHRLNLSGNYTVPLGDNVGELSFGANWAYSSSYSLSVFEDPLGVENGYNQLDLRADWNNIAGKEGLSLGVFVNNVTKELYKIGGVPIYSVLGTTSLLYNEPRTWGVQLRYRFGE